MKNRLLDSYLLRSILFFPRRIPRPSNVPPNVIDGTILVELDIELGYRLYKSPNTKALILYFHGNGEIVTDYDDLSAEYLQLNLSLLVIDYRGYGWSSGTPKGSALLSDVEAVHLALPQILTAAQLQDVPLFLMGRSLGSISATHMASFHPDAFSGLIIESGLAHVFLVYFPIGFLSSRLLSWLPDLFGNLRKMRKIQLPLLIIHGEKDRVLPVRNGQNLYEASPTATKTLCRLPDVGHNDLFVRSIDAYFAAISEFVNANL
jgi:alpha-beta hydrolase superfamily lysophospholipase